MAFCQVNSLGGIHVRAFDPDLILDPRRDYDMCCSKYKTNKLNKGLTSLCPLTFFLFFLNEKFKVLTLIFIYYNQDRPKA